MVRARAVKLVRELYTISTSPWTTVTSASRLPESTAVICRKKSLTEDFIMRSKLHRCTASQPQRLVLGGGVY